MSNALNWFEIPASDLDRAIKFYNAVFDTELAAQEAMPGYRMAMLPYEQGVGVGGAIVQGEGYTPSTEGSTIYLDAGDDLSVALGRVEGAGGQVLTPKTDIGENGFMAYFQDTEGNKVALHSMG
jgi:predicted enzyme related to lactoylglutathione lyase